MSACFLDLAPEISLQFQTDVVLVFGLEAREGRGDANLFCNLLYQFYICFEQFMLQ